MKLQTVLSAVTALAAVVEAGPTRGGYMARRQVGVENEEDTPAGKGTPMAGMQMGNDVRAGWPAWNFVNGTTPDATADGKVGVLLEPDLIPGSKGKDGGKVVKSKW
jgi:hypothetical protein